MEKQMNWQNIKSILIVSLVLFIIGFFLYECHRDIKNGDTQLPKDAYKYETTEIYRDKYFRLKDSLRKVKLISPILLEKWLSPEPIEIDSMSIIKGYLKLYPREKNEVTVNTDFILNYPKSPKLVSMDLVKDSITLSLYYTDSKLQSLTYPLYLDNYGYRFSNDEMGMYDLPSKPIQEVKPRMRWDNLYFNAGYDVYNKVPTSGLEYNLVKGRFKLDLNAEALILQKPELNVNAKIGYRLFK